MAQLRCEAWFARRSADSASGVSSDRTLCIFGVPADWFWLKVGRQGFSSRVLEKFFGCRLPRYGHVAKLDAVTGLVKQSW